MGRAVVHIRSQADRNLITNWTERVPDGTRVEFKGTRRSNDQNSKLWAGLTDIAVQVEWHGQRLTTNEWKLVFLDALKRELKIVPNLDGDGFVNVGRSSSDLSKQEFSDLLELIAAFGARHGVIFHDPLEMHS